MRFPVIPRVRLELLAWKALDLSCPGATSLLSGFPLLPGEAAEEVPSAMDAIRGNFPGGAPGGHHGHHGHPALDPWPGIPGIPAPSQPGILRKRVEPVHYCISYRATNIGVHPIRFTAVLLEIQPTMGPALTMSQKKGNAKAPETQRFRPGSVIAGQFRTITHTAQLVNGPRRSALPIRFVLALGKRAVAGPFDTWLPPLAELPRVDRDPFASLSDGAPPPEAARLPLLDPSSN